jgi:hypothetical protein
MVDLVIGGPKVHVKNLIGNEVNEKEFDLKKINAVDMVKV